VPAARIWNAAMTHGHSHAVDAARGDTARRRLALVLVITFTLMIVEAIGGVVTGSLALLADAAHMLSDVGALGFALFAAWFASRPSPPRNTFGYQRIEILAAQIQAVMLTLVLFFIVHEAIERFRTPTAIQVGPMALLGFLGLAGNVVSIALLRHHAHHSLNVRGAYLEVMADMLASVGVLIAAACTHFLRWRLADPVISLGIAAFILPRIWLLLREVTDVLMESAPRHLDMTELRQAILEQPGVVTVHDLHVWAITPNRVCMSAHLVGATDADRDRIILAVNRMLRVRFDVRHSTLQVEGADNPAFSTPASDDAACDPCVEPQVSPASSTVSTTAENTVARGRSRRLPEE
jgi:cobalt-zinc-cadmium efflux system protein